MSEKALLKTGQSKPGETTHGITTWLKTGRLNPSIRGHRKLQAYLKQLERDLSECQGEMTAAREILIKGTLEAYGVLLLASLYCKEAGILRPDQKRRGIIELQPVLGQQFLAFLNTIRCNLVALGLDRKAADKVIDLEAYAKARYGKEEKKKDGKASGN